MIKGINHITFVVSDLEETSLLFQNILNAEEVYSGPTAKYLTINGIWLALNLGESQERSYNHIAFTVSEQDLDMYMSRILSHNVELLVGRDRIAGEGNSIYFYDYDNHLIELHTGTLSERLESYAKNT
jgi:catechol 2,3-dioxygenase-like lactoylglutathione lyase family enzyme